MKKGYAKVHHGTDPHAKRPQESAMHVLRLTKEGTYDGRVLAMEAAQVVKWDFRTLLELEV